METVHMPGAQGTAKHRSATGKDNGRVYGGMATVATRESAGTDGNRGRGRYRTTPMAWPRQSDTGQWPSYLDTGDRIQRTWRCAHRQSSHQADEVARMARARDVDAAASRSDEVRTRRPSGCARPRGHGVRRCGRPRCCRSWRNVGGVARAGAVGAGRGAGRRERAGGWAPKRLGGRFRLRHLDRSCGHQG
ncbi:hypothetical protein PYCCODRAFT_316850 [Trametes coccinea BRFM310]|uniref:Uncharacterized protein n=1 Tax=Trametes coccinea (strain BRFM310) TaxID=1353009 RepID=A0A1Y2IP65_TRAC3|nr:hypothetical protein PYCCODRAFT_316850 [Trametes coccinea BRFM310]